MSIISKLWHTCLPPQRTFFLFHLVHLQIFCFTHVGDALSCHPGASVVLSSSATASIVLAAASTATATSSSSSHHEEYGCALLADVTIGLLLMFTC
jgi:hypothetical protein